MPTAYSILMQFYYTKRLKISFAELKRVLVRTLPFANSLPKNNFHKGMINWLGFSTNKPL